MILQNYKSEKQQGEDKGKKNKLNDALTKLAPAQYIHPNGEYPKITNSLQLYIYIYIRFTLLRKGSELYPWARNRYSFPGFVGAKDKGRFCKTMGRQHPAPLVP